MTVAVPVQVGSQLFFTTFYDGPLMLSLDQDRPGASVAWKGTSNSEIQTDGLHAVLATPIIDGGYIYGICSYGQLRCLNASTGERILESQEATTERRRWVSGFMVKNGNRVFITNDRGELIISRLSRRVRGNQPDPPDHAHLPTRQPAGAAHRELGSPGLRQQAHLHAERRGNHQRVDGRGGLRLIRTTRGRARVCWRPTDDGSWARSRVRSSRVIGRLRLTPLSSHK